MLNEIQLQKLINRDFIFVSVSKDDAEFTVSKLTSEGWEVKNVSTDKDLSDELNKYIHKPDVILEVEDEISNLIN